MVDPKLKAKADENAAMTGAVRPTSVYCQTCKFAHGEAPWADDPLKANCEVYTYGDSLKPHDVMFNGAPCEFYVKKE